MKTSFSLMIMLALLWMPAFADPSVEALFEKVKAVNPNLQDYSAQIDIQMEVWVTILPYKPTAHGKYYFKRPDKHKLQLDKAPSYLKKYPKIFGWNLPKLEKYRSVVEKEMVHEGRNVYQVVMLPKGQVGDIIRQELLIDKEFHTVPLQRTYYKDNGLLEVRVKYKKESGFRVFETMNAKFDFPKASVQATAEARYKNYKFNQGLDDSFFNGD